MRTVPTTNSTAPGPATSAAIAPAPAAEPGSSTTTAHHDDPVLARALLSAWSGDPAVVVASPPGAGKTRLGAHLAQQLADRAGLVVAIAAQTRAQAVEVTNRVAATGTTVALLGAKKSLRPDGLQSAARYAPGPDRLRTTSGVVVSTTARWRVTPAHRFTADVLIVDEAWQMTWADLGSLGPLAHQIVLIGDPGQIAPVVTGDTSRWAGWATGPHRPAPEALISAYPSDVTRLTLPQTWRLGPATTALIQPNFYPDLPFTSARPDRTLRLRGQQEPELASRTLNGCVGKDDPALAEAAAERVRDLLDGGVVNETGGSRSLTEQDVAVVVPHVSQAALIGAHLADRPGVLVGTANAVQGLERDAVVVVHPLAGYRDPGALEFAADLGRLCVALSRHRVHVTVVMDDATPQVLRQALTANPSEALRVQQTVMAALIDVAAA